MNLDPDVAAVRSAVRSALADLSPGVTVLVACSGGPDSLALAAATAFAGPRLGMRCGAVVVDHGLLPGSGEVAAQAGRQCHDLGLDPVDVVTVHVGRVGRAGRLAGLSSPGPEAAARAARHAALEAAALRHDAAAVLLGHTLDDQAESVLLGLARGSGARSLAGMAGRRDLLRRPFLALRRAQTVHVCEVLGLDPWQDPSNGPDPSADLPLRSRVRHDVMPVLEAVLGPGVADALARTADQLREDADVLDHLAGELLARARDGAGDLDAAVLAGAPTALRRRALRVALVAAGVPAGGLGRVHVVAVDALVTDWHGQGPVALPGGGRVLRRCGRLTFTTATQGAASGGSIGHG